MAKGICELCLKLDELCDSHIIPNAYFKRIKQRDHSKPVTFDDAPLSMVEKKGTNWYEQMLCGDCEAKVAGYRKAENGMVTF